MQIGQEVKDDCEGVGIASLFLEESNTSSTASFQTEKGKGNEAG